MLRSISVITEISNAESSSSSSSSSSSCQPTINIIYLRHSDIGAAVLICRLAALVTEFDYFSDKKRI